MQDHEKKPADNGEQKTAGPVKNIKQKQAKPDRPGTDKIKRHAITVIE